MQKIKVWFKSAATHIKKIAKYTPNVVDFLSKIATIGVCVVAIFGYVYTIKPTYDIKVLEKEVKNLKEEKSTLSSIIDSNQEKIKESDIIIKSKIQEVANLNNEIQRIEKIYYDEIISKLLEPNYELLKIPLSNFSDEITGTIEEIRNLAKQPNQLAEQKLKELKEKQQQSTSQIGKQIYAKILKQYKQGLEKSQKYLKCIEPNYIDWEKIEIQAKELKNDSEILDKCQIKWEKQTMELNNWDKNRLEEVKKVSKGLQKSEIEHINVCTQYIKLYTNSYFREKMRTYTQACYSVIYVTNNIIMQKYDLSKIETLKEKISNPNINKLKKYILDQI